MKIGLIIAIAVIVILIGWIYLDCKDIRKLRKRNKELERELYEKR